MITVITQADESNASRFEKIDKLYVKTPKIAEIFEAINLCRQSAKTSHEPFCLLIEGDKGSGKTTLGQMYLKDLVVEKKREAQHVPGFLATIPVRPTERKVAQEILRSLNEPFFNSGNAYTLTNRSYKLLDKLGTEIAFFDEIQHFRDKENEKDLLNATDWLKNYLKIKPLPGVFMGISQQAKAVIKSNAQLASLFINSFELTNFTWDAHQPETITEFRSFLKSVQVNLPLRHNEKSEIFEPTLAYEIFRATDGSLRNLMRIIRFAATGAILTGQEFIDRGLLAAAFHKVGQGLSHDLGNPFLE